ncbi:MAG: DUF6252 family protein [Bacteroidota bacterium]|nr:DUF6252 family protein [Bacteroidota bacterium]
MRYYLFSLISLLLLAGGCKKPDNKPKEPMLPPATQTGAYTFGCRVNGKIWLPKTNSLKLPLRVQYHNGELHIDATKIQDDTQSFIGFTYLSGVTTPGIYPIRYRPNQGDKSVIGFYSELKDYYADSAGSGFLTITRLDTAEEVISGTFHFDAFSDDGDTLHITDGRFDADF